jgi:hypothetical protein
MQAIRTVHKRQMRTIQTTLQVILDSTHQFFSTGAQHWRAPTCSWRVCLSPSRNPNRACSTEKWRTPKQFRFGEPQQRTLLSRHTVPRPNDPPPLTASSAQRLCQWMTFIPVPLFSFASSTDILRTLVFGDVEKTEFWADSNPFPAGSTRGQTLTPYRKGRFGSPLCGAH